jgi:hypothetical protein
MVISLEVITAWEEKLAIRRSAVLFITLWMTWRAFDWSARYVESVGADNDAMLAAAAMVAAVTAPITYLQAAVFKAYIESKTP